MEIMRWRPDMPCAECGSFLKFELNYLFDFFTGRSVNCSQCGHVIDWLKTAAKEAGSDGWPFFLTMLGGTGYWITGDMAYLNRPFILSLAKYDIPENALIVALYIKALYESEDETVTLTLLPLLKGTDSQDVVDIHWELQDGAAFWPVIFPLGSSISSNQRFVLEQRGAPVFIQVWCTTPEAVQRQSEELLVSGFLALRRGDYKRSCLDAHTALDLALEDAVLGYLEQESDTSVRIYGLEPKLQILDGLLKVMRDRDKIIKQMNFHLPQEVKKGIVRLNKRRNDIAHPRRQERSLTKSETAELLAISFLAIKYVEFARVSLFKFKIVHEDEA